MPGNREGGLRAARKNKKFYGADFYARIGAMGGVKSRGGGFAYSRAKAVEAGRIGGTRSKRGMRMVKGLFGVRYEKIQ